MTEKEKQLIDSVNSVFENLRAKRALTNEQVEICKKYGVDPERYTYQDQGSIGHKIANKVPLGKYIAGKGYYKIIQVHYNYQVPDGRTFEEVLITKYSKEFTTNFTGEEVVINARPLYNKASHGPMCKLNPGMILHVKEDTTIENNTYRIVWELI